MELIADLRHALRLLLRAPLLTLTIVITLGLGIGATTATFGVVRGVLLRPLPYPDAGRLLRLSEVREGRGPGPRGFGGITNETFDAWRASPKTVEGIGAWSPRAHTLSGRGEPVRILGTAVSGDTFRLLGATPLLGRLFSDADDGTAAGRLVVLGHEEWREGFGADPAIVGRVIHLDEEPHTVVGVTGPGFYFPDRSTRLWTVLRVLPPSGPNPEERIVQMFPAIARLRPGSTPAQAAAEGTSAARSATPPRMAGMIMLGEGGPATIRAVPLLDDLTRGIRPALLVLMAAVGLVLVVASANVANLLLARAIARQRDLAIRLALGAQRSRLVRQVTTEGAVLAGLGAAAGLALAFSVIRLLPAWAPEEFPRIEDVAVDTRVALFALAVSTGAAVLFALAPAWHISRFNLLGLLHQSAAQGLSGFRRLPGARLRAGLIVAEVAVAVVLLIGAGLLGRSFIRLMSLDAGYDPTNVLTAQVSFPQSRYDRHHQVEFVRALLDRVRALPSVRSAGSVNLLPLAPGGTAIIFDRLGPPGPDGRPEVVSAGVYLVSPGYLEAMGMRLVAGRTFRDTDVRSSQPVLIVNESFVRRYVGQNSALGQRFPGALERGDREWEIVGVVGDVRRESLSADPEPEIYASMLQLEDALGMMGPQATLAIRTVGDPVALGPPLRSFVRELDPALALDGVMTMERRVSRAAAQPRFHATLLVLSAGAALLLASVGLYGILAYSVAQRQREVGVRSALGAEPGDLVRLVLGEGLWLAAIGLVAGLAVAAGLARFVSSMLYGVRPHDTATFVTVPLLVVAVATIACLVPARRAARLDPVTALRSE
jgi:putative ABC transport system permease protein